MNENNCKLAMRKHPSHFSFYEYFTYIIIFYADFEILDREVAVDGAKGYEACARVVFYSVLVLWRRGLLLISWGYSTKANSGRQFCLRITGMLRDLSLCSVSRRKCRTC